MFSNNFMRFLISYDSQEENETEYTDNNLQEIEFNSPKVTEAAKIVISAIKELY